MIRLALSAIDTCVMFYWTKHSNQVHIAQATNANVLLTFWSYNAALCMVHTGTLLAILLFPANAAVNLSAAELI